MHVPIEGRMLGHRKKMLRSEGEALLMNHLGASKQEAEKICNREYDGYISYPKLKEFYTTHLGRANILA
jgi:hypothetical protein